MNEIEKLFIEAFEKIRKLSGPVHMKIHSDTQKLVDKEYKELYEKYKEIQNANRRRNCKRN